MAHEFFKHPQVFEGWFEAGRQRNEIIASTGELSSLSERVWAKNGFQRVNGGGGLLYGSYPRLDGGYQNAPEVIIQNGLVSHRVRVVAVFPDEQRLVVYSDGDRNSGFSPIHKIVGSETKILFDPKKLHIGESDLLCVRANNCVQRATSLIAQMNQILRTGESYIQ